MLDMDGHTMPADVTSSKFFHKLDAPAARANYDALDAIESGDQALQTREIIAQLLDIEAPYLAIIIVLSVLGCILVCGLAIGLILYRRRTTGMYPKGSTTLASPGKAAKKSRVNMDVVPRGFPRVGIHSDSQHSPSQSSAKLSPTVPRSKRQNRNAEAW